MKKQHTHRKSGYMLVTILLVVTTLSIGLASLIHFGSQRTFTAQRMVDRTKALAYAEAGIEYAFSVLKSDFSNKNDPTKFKGAGASITNDGLINSPYGSGSFTLAIEPVDGDRYCIVRSTGVCGEHTFTAEVVAEDKLAGTTPDPEPTGDATKIILPDIPVVSNGPFTLGGDVNVTGIDGSTPSIHSNSDSAVSQKQSKANYYMTTSGNWTKKTPKNGATGVPKQNIPEIPLEAYEGAAYKINAGDSIPSPVPGGILYIENPAGTQTTIKLGGTIQATIILAEGISVNSPSGIDLTPGINPENGESFGIALAPKGGDFSFNGGDITGLIYLPNGDFDMHGNPRLTGQVLVNGDTTWGGTPDAFVYTETILNPPATDTTTTPMQDVWIGAWQK